MTHNKPHTKKKVTRDRGQALMITVIFLIMVSTVIMVGSSSPTVRDLISSRTLITSKASYYTSEAGVEDALYRIKKAKQLSNPEEMVLNNGTASVQVNDVSGSQKEITASSYVLSSERKVKTSIFVGIGSDFVYGAQVGAGGLKMGDFSRIEGSGGAEGNVFSNGPVLGAGALKTAHITGDAIAATTFLQDTQASHDVYNSDQIVGQQSSQADFAQSFVPSDNMPLSRVSFYMKKVGAPSSPNIRIVADNGGVPKTTALASVLLQSNTVTTSYNWVTVTFSPAIDLVAGTTYWILIDANANPTNYYVVGKDSAGGYVNGVVKYSTGWQSYPWTAIAGDLNFKTYFGYGNGLIQYVTVEGNSRAYANTVKDSVIGGTAYCQTGSGNNKSCNTSLPDPTPVPFPVMDTDITQLKADALIGGVITGDCGSDGVSGCRIDEDNPLYLGPKKIEGNLSIEGEHRILRLTGVLHVTGNIDLTDKAEIRCAASYGSDSCVIITDGYVNIANDTKVLGSGTSGSYILFISTKVGCNGVSQSGCASGYAGITIDGALIDNGDHHEGVFYSTDSMINIKNFAKVAAVAGYKLNLEQNAKIDYEFGVVNTFFFSGPGGGWNVKSWNEVQ